MKIGVILEGKTPPDKRVPLSPAQCEQVVNTYPDIDLVIQRSQIRKFSDSEYEDKGLTLVDDLSDRDVIIGVKEVPLDMLLPNKTYFFFSHTIKEQPYNKKLLQTVLDRNISLIDWECLTNAKGNRLIGFGRYAGIVGAYNGLLAWGKRFNSFDLKAAHLCEDRKEMEGELSKMNLPAIKILLTGRGRVAKGAEETLRAAGIRKVEVEVYLNESFDEPVYAQIGVEYYNKRKDGGEGSRQEFYTKPELYESDFMRFAAETDYFIAGHYYAEGSPFLYTREDVRKPEFNIQVVADVSCDIDGPVATTIEPSTIAVPIYGYNPITEQKDDFRKEGNVTVMAVDNLPCELPKDASIDFGSEFIQHILPNLVGEDKGEILKRATIAKGGSLTPDYTYLSDYVKG